MISTNSAATLLGILLSSGTRSLKILRVWRFGLPKFPSRDTREAKFGGRLSGTVLSINLIHTHIALRSYILVLPMPEIPVFSVCQLLRFNIECRFNVLFCFTKIVL